ncbi:unnamed protein product [Rhodiola kirilowii]
MPDKDEPEGRLEARHEQNDPTMERPLTTSHKAPPGKSKDPGAFTVTCGIGEAQIHHYLMNLGAAVNVIPYSLYCSLKLGPLKPPKLLIKLGDKSCIWPVSLLEDLTLRVGDLVVPSDFYVLQMGDARDDDPPALILGRPFLFTTKTKIDMGIGLLSLTFGGKTSDFYIYGDDDRLMSLFILLGRINLTRYFNTLSCEQLLLSVVLHFRCFGSSRRKRALKTTFCAENITMADQTFGQSTECWEWTNNQKNMTHASSRS